jgi:hypothetical protein
MCAFCEIFGNVYSFFGFISKQKDPINAQEETIDHNTVYFDHVPEGSLSKRQWQALLSPKLNSYPAIYIASFFIYINRYT